MRKRENKQNHRPILRHFTTWLHGAGAKCALIYAVGTLVLLVLFAAACAPQRYSLSVGAISHQTITATKDVEDTVTTESRRREASVRVEATYHFQEGVTESVLSDLDETFRQLRIVQQYGLTLRVQDGETATETNLAATFSAEEIDYALQQVEAVSLTRYQATVLMRASTENFDTMAVTVRLAVESALNTTIREGQVSQSIAAIKQIAGYRVETSLMQNIVPVVLNHCIRPNMVIDQELTAQAQENAAAQVEPVVYLQGQNIIREGERVQANQLAMLEALGLLDTASYDYDIYLGALLLIAISMSVLILMLVILAPEVLRDVRRSSVIMVVLVLCEGLCVIAVKLLDVYLAPVVMAAMLLTTLLSARVGISATFTMALIAAGLSAGSSNAYSAEMVHLILTGVVSGIVAVQYLKDKPQRVRMVIAGVIVAVVNMVVILAMSLMTSNNISGMMTNAMWSMAGGILSGLISVGFQPVFEAAFNLATPAKLLELANPNQPLLRRLLLEAPGTYHHAIVVANLAEAAAEKIGANPLLARTGAYFHDIGKLKRPLYFKENQMGDNPHDRTDPYVSAAIVTAHTRDGLALAQKYHLPPEIQTIIMEHHGDTPVMYFYHKALQMADGKPVDIADFRYDGQRPTTKESAIVMLADTIEAAVRSIPDPTPKAIEQFIERLVRGKLEDGQLSNSPLTLRDIDAICEAFCKVLNGVFHERIEYPTVNVPARPLVKAEKEAEKETKQMQAEIKAEKQAEVEKTPEVKPEAKAEKQAEAEKTPEVKAEAKAEKPDVPEKPAAPVEESEENT